MSFPAVKSLLMVVSPDPRLTAAQGVTLLAPEMGIPMAGMDGMQWISLCSDIVSWSGFFSRDVLRMLEIGSSDGYWDHSSYNLWPLSLQLLPFPTFLLMMFSLKSSLLTSFPRWMQLPLSNSTCTSRLVAATLPYKKRRNPSSPISNYCRQAGKPCKDFGSQKR